MAHAITKSTTAIGWNIGSTAIQCLLRRIQRMGLIVCCIVLAACPKATGQSFSNDDSDVGEVLLPPPALAPLTEAEPFRESVSSRFVGSRSCASSSCHGDPRRETVVGSAAHYFFDADKHQNAGTVLRSQRSQMMASRLNLKMPPWEAYECLACHAPGAMEDADRTHRSAMVSEGVSCESCHGAARDWLVPHRAPEWHYSDVWSADRKKAIGFLETKKLAIRVDRCADCHVGNGKQSVNHDLIAAGHPRLMFEFSADQSRIPIHWRQSLERQRSAAAIAWPSSRQSTYEARNWLLGQIVTADHELEILSEVVSRPGMTLPELAQYDCFACHHALSSPTWRQARSAWGIRPGELPWGTWSLGLLSESQPDLSDVLTQEFVTTQQLLLQQLKTTRFNQDEVQRLVVNLRQELFQARPLAIQKPLTSDDLTTIRNRLLAERSKISDQGWDRSAQLFLALVALDKGANDAMGLGDRVPANREASYKRLRALLSFQETRNEKPAFDHLESPVKFETSFPEIKKELERMQHSDVTSDTTIRTDGSVENLPLLPTPQSLEIR